MSEEQDQPSKGIENIDMCVIVTIDAAVASQDASLAAELLRLGVFALDV